ncbi:hypothetical protein ABAC460_08855 [Asticcacaulis sp. AC460]|uniref:hypothetical protein n=1 Tax=Asticcacaulis sp. AC460 TaxID=1282360 RepID=UPI0003C3E139|nr:hypothetical protein [Asticcacaulis sp. AC460]ESQ90587.1 hypothetical protein ABAC460_08855 [Asticcacaulis sp. AC460]
MKRVFAGIAVFLMTASSVQAAPFRLYDVSDEQHCECDCYISLHRANARPDSRGYKPAIVVILSHAEIRIDGQPIRLTETDEETSSGWPVYINEQAGVRLEPHLRRDGRVPDLGYLKFIGDIRVTYRGSSMNIPVDGLNWCDVGDDV